MDMLSVIITARNEVVLNQTVESVLSNAVEDVEVVVILDGYEPKEMVPLDSRVVVIHHKESQGQRQSINEGCRAARGKYMMKLDAHCAVAPWFDKVLKEDCEYEWTMVPRMYNLDVTTFTPKKHKRTDYMYISSPHHRKPFRAMYYGNYEGAVSKKPHSDKLIDDTMCCMGPGWFMHMDRFWEQGGCDEGHGGWGQQGIEVACKAWLSGGALKVNKKTWFAHWFRGGGVPEGFNSGFPYSMPGRNVERARKYSRKLWLGNKWNKQVRSFQWLVDKFDPPTWKKDYDVSVIIPSYKDPYLHKTIQSILDNFESDFEIIPVLDGYVPEERMPVDSRVKPLYLKNNVGMREAINAGVRVSLGKYIMRSDEHCMFCKGFDRLLLEDVKDGQIMTARRYYLDPIKWEVMEDKGYVDHEKLMIMSKKGYTKFASVRSKGLTKRHEDSLVDEMMAWQGSMWIMTRNWWDKVIKELQTDGYGPLYQDTTEMSFKTWKAGGKLMLSKKAWFAHKHRNFNRSHQYSHERATPEWMYAINKWYPMYQKVRKLWDV